MDFDHHPPGSVGSRQGRGLLRLGIILDLVCLRADSSAKNAADYDLYDRLQTALAHRRRLSLVAGKRTCRLTRRSNDPRVPLDSPADHRRPLEICISELCYVVED